MSRCIWALVDGELADQLRASSEPSAKAWLFSMIEVLSHAAFLKLAVTLWATWTARRKAIHEGDFQSPHATHAFITRYMADLEIIKGQQPSANVARAHPAGNIRPRAPPTGFAKIHVDAGVSKRYGKGSAVAVCRDEQGMYLGSSALVINGLQDAATLETIACREAYALAEDLALQNFIIASDAKQVVSDINQRGRGTYGTIIEEIKARAANFNTKIVFEGRLANNDAHSLARFSLKLAQGRHLWLIQPHDPCIPQIVAFDE